MPHCAHGDCLQVVDALLGPGSLDEFLQSCSFQRVRLAAADRDTLFGSSNRVGIPSEQGHCNPVSASVASALAWLQWPTVHAYANIYTRAWALLYGTPVVHAHPYLQTQALLSSVDLKTVVSASSKTVVDASRVHRLSGPEQWTLCAYQIIRALEEQVNLVTRQVGALFHTGAVAADAWSMPAGLSALYLSRHIYGHNLALGTRPPEQGKK